MLLDVMDMFRALSRYMILLAATVVGSTSTSANANEDGTVPVYFGTYTSGKSQGIYQARFDGGTGTLTSPELAAKVGNPSFLALHPEGRFLYAVGENGNFRGQNSGSIMAFSIEKPSGRLALINEQSSVGAAPCHLALDGKGRWLFVANYTGGNIAMFRVRLDGGLEAASQIIPHRGSSIDPQRQQGPHAHYICTDPSDRRVLACDLGLDKVLVYSLDPAAGTLEPNDPPSARVYPGAGPRHLAFHPNGRVICVINEMGSKLASFSYDADSGTLAPLHTASTLPAGFKGKSTCAEVQIHPCGRFVYASNRGADTIAVLTLNGRTGSMEMVQNVLTGGKTPRHFTFDPSGKWLLAANQDSDSITIFSVDPKTGTLQSTGNQVEVGAPVCILFQPKLGS